MSRIPNRRAIINRKALTAELNEQIRINPGSTKARANALQIFKAALYRGVGEIKRRFEEDRARGAEVVQSNAFLVDQLVRTIYEFALIHVFPDAARASDDEMAIIATGGYGRAELSPFSDIDVMFLLSRKATAGDEQIVEYVLYTLWDCGLKVGHATRTIDECVRLGRADSVIRTSLLEARWLWGNQKLFQAFEQRFLTDVIAGTGQQFIETKLAERNARHERMGDSRYVLEPHIKDGKGGLRDLQTLFWIGKYLYHVKDVGQLVDKGVFTPSDYRHFRIAENFLWTVRCHLHYAAGRPEERLTFGYQGIIAERLGYTDRPSATGVERFMKHYFHVTKTVGDLTRVLCAVLEDEHKKARLRFRLPGLGLGVFKRLPSGLKMDGNRVNVDNHDVFARNPLLLLKLFHEAERLGVDIHPKALRLVQQNLNLIDAQLRNDPEANRLFLDMLTSRNDPEVVLKRLSEAGVFGRFIPEFGRVIAQMQYDMYHVYTVDEHSIRAIGILHRIERGELKAEHPGATIAVGEIRSRRVLYLSTLLHDLGKGRGGDHSVIGAELAKNLSRRLGLDEWETETVSWLVLHHLLMSRTAFKRDIDDPKTVADFIAIVQSPERLRLLLVLTNADVHAVGPNIWNGWKAGLLDELYYRALEEMEMTGGQPPERSGNRVEVARAKARARLAERDPALVEMFLGLGYPDYWLAFDVEEHIRHFDLVRHVAGQEQGFAIDIRQHPARDTTELTIYSPDHPGLFAQIAGAIALGSASIVDAKIITLSNSMALDVFHIQDLNGRALHGDERLARLKQRLEKSIVGELRLDRELREFRRHGGGVKQQGLFNVPTRVIFDNKASANHTVIEVNGRDRVAFLYDVTATLTRLGLQIFSAHISTYGERVVDVFYVKDVFGLKIEHPSKLEKIERRLLEVIEPENAVVANAAK